MVVRLKPTLPVLLSFNGGYVDTAGILTKLLALPVFCIVIILTRWASFSLPGHHWPVLRTMLTLRLLL